MKKKKYKKIQKNKKNSNQLKFEKKNLKGIRRRIIKLEKNI